MTWTLRESALDNQWVSVTFGDGLFVALSNSGTGDRAMTSPNGETWTLQSSGVDLTWQNVRYGRGLFVAVASGGSGRAMTSPNGRLRWA
jgi:hypothetical protein